MKLKLLHFYFLSFATMLVENGRGIKGAFLMGEAKFTVRLQFYHLHSLRTCMLYSAVLSGFGFLLMFYAVGELY